MDGERAEKLAVETGETHVAEDESLGETTWVVPVTCLGRGRSKSARR